MLSDIMEKFAEKNSIFLEKPFVGSNNRSGRERPQMFKNLNTKSLGITARQNEMIELALTYKFSGFDIDIESLMQQAEQRGQEHATRFIDSANIRIGSFELPVDLAASDEDFARDLAGLAKVAELAETLGATDRGG